MLNAYFCEQSTIDDRAATLPDLELPDSALLNAIYITDDDVREASYHTTKFKQSSRS